MSKEKDPVGPGYEFGEQFEMEPLPPPPPPPPPANEEPTVPGWKRP